jgi:hypothetical protein
MAIGKMARRRSGAVVASRVVHAVLATVVLGSLGIQLVLVFSGGADVNSGEVGGAVPVGGRLWRLFSYFTIESNLLVLGTAVVLAWRPRVDGVMWRVVRLDALLGTVITGLVFAVVLAPQVHLTGAAFVSTVGFHYISPWLTLAAWLVFGPRPRVTWWTVLAAFIWPLVWLVYVFMQGSFTNWYPYPFLDVNELGLFDAVRNALLVCGIAVVLAVVFRFLDGQLPGLVDPGGEGEGRH